MQRLPPRFKSLKFFLGKIYGQIFLPHFNMFKRLVWRRHAARKLTCDHTLPPLYLDAVKEGMIHLLAGSYVKKPDSGVFSDWSRNNAYETLRSYWLTYFNLISGQKVETEARF